MNLLENLPSNVKLCTLKMNEDGGQYKFGAYVKVSSSEYVGMIVGKGGSNIIRPSMENQTRVQNPAENAEPCFVVKGNSLKGVILMSQWICDKNDQLLKHHTSKDTNIIEKRVRCCQKFVSLLVGPKGRTVKDIMTKSNTNIQSPPKSNKPKCFTVSGNRESVESAVCCMQKYIYMYGVTKSDITAMCEECQVYGSRCANLKVISEPLHALTHSSTHLHSVPRSTTQRLPSIPKSPYEAPFRCNPVLTNFDSHIDTLTSNFSNLAASTLNMNSQKSSVPFNYSYTPSFQSSDTSSSSSDEIYMRILEEANRPQVNYARDPVFRQRAASLAADNFGGPEQWKKWEDDYMEKKRQQELLSCPSFTSSSSRMLAKDSITKELEDLLNDKEEELKRMKSGWDKLYFGWPWGDMDPRQGC